MLNSRKFLFPSPIDACLFHPGYPIFHDALKVGTSPVDLTVLNVLAVVIKDLFSVSGLVLLPETDHRLLRIPGHPGEFLLTLTIPLCAGRFIFWCPVWGPTCGPSCGKSSQKSGGWCTIKTGNYILMPMLSEWDIQ